VNLKTQIILHTRVVHNAEIVLTIKIRAEKPTLGQAHLFFANAQFQNLKK
jgi:hypothetical protein